jgi:hypothetical protein
MPPSSFRQAHALPLVWTVDSDARRRAAERKKIIAHNQKRQKLLDEISGLRERVGAMRIEMEQDYYARTFNEPDWEKRFDALQNEIASKIEQFSSKAEAVAYRHRGNIQRPLNTNMGGLFEP